MTGDELEGIENWQVEGHNISEYKGRYTAKPMMEDKNAIRIKIIINIS